MLVALFLFARGAGGRATAPATPQPDPVDDGIVRVVQNPAAQAPFLEPEPPSPLQTAGATSNFYRDFIIGAESGGIPGRLNKSSLACGIPQALPCTKLYPHATKEWIRENYIVDEQGRWILPDPNPEYELAWMEQYVLERYGTWEKAYLFWKENRWY